MKETINMENNLNEVEYRDDFKSFEDLASFFAEKYPDLINISVDDEAKLLQKTNQRDIAVENIGVLELFKEYGLSSELLTELGDKKWAIRHKDQMTEDLPSGYGFKGGAARFYLKKSLGLPADLPRDYDVVRLTETEPYQGADDEIARRFMPKDFEFGDGVEYVANIDDYFKTRDLTVNEVMVTQENIIATESALLDILRNILRLTDFERHNYNPNGLAGPKMLAKILRFYSESIQSYEGMSAIKNIGDIKIDEVFISPFWLAVNLDRALERGRKQAVNYIDVLLNTKQLPESVITPEDAMDYLLSCMNNESFIFRSADRHSFDMEDKWVEDLHEKEGIYISKIRKGVIKR